MKEIRLFLATLKAQGAVFYLEDGALKSKARKGSITDKDRAFVKANKEAIVAYLSSLNNDNKASNITGVSFEQRQNSQLSFAQMRLWFIDKLQGSSLEYNMPMALQVDGELDISLVKKVLAQIIERHEILRTVYVEDETQTLARIKDINEIAFDIGVCDLTGLTGETLNDRVQHLIEQDVATEFDLARDLMVRVSYLKTTQDQGVLLFNMHHIASDGWSLEVLIKEFYALYQAYAQGEDNPLPALELQYGDYAKWQREHLEGEVLESQLNYWQKQLDELPAVHSLALDFPRPEVKRHRGARISSELSADTAKGLLSVAKTHQLTPFMLLHGALSLMLSRHSNSNDIVIGTPVANRLQSELQSLIGFFVNTLVLRVDTQQDSLEQYFNHVKKVHLEAQANQDVPFEQLVDRLKIPRSTVHTPLFQIMLNTNTDYGLNDNASNDSISLPGIEMRPMESTRINAKFELNIGLNISEKGVGLYWTYDADLFTHDHIQQFNDHLCRLLEALASGEINQPSELPMLSAQETEQLVFGHNNTHKNYDLTECVHQRFEQQVSQSPDATAVLFEGREISYQGLNDKANQLANYLLAEHHIEPDTLVGLCVERSIEMVVGILAILKAGGAYVPMDPSYPEDRLNYMVGDAGVKVVLSANNTDKILSDFNGSLVNLDGILDSDTHFAAAFGKNNPAVEALSAANLAYVIYTSGSTGQPKGVMIEHRNLADYMLANEHNYFDPELFGSLIFTTLSFDLSIPSLYLPLIHGQTVELASNHPVMSDNVGDILLKDQARLLRMTPSHVQLLLDQLDGRQGRASHVFVVGGEALDGQLVSQLRRAFKNMRLYNHYGPSESTIGCTSYFVDSQNNDQNVPIGKPMANAQMLVLSSDGQLVAKGVTGELYIGGNGLARGYHNRPELTAERFLANPYYDAKKADSCERLYRTGDLVRMLDDGNLEFIGRADDQVKVRGFRIELGEIENQLAALESVDSALVMVKALSGADQLVGYIKPADSVAALAQDVLISDVTTALKANLPEYMVPSIIMCVDGWPLTPNGKINRKALPAPDGSALQGEYIEPNGETEQQLAAVWGKLLGIEPNSISRTANFFELGGHSLLTVRMSAEIRRALSIEVSVQDIFDNAVLKNLADVIEQNGHEVVRAPLVALARQSDTMPVSFAQQRLWFIDRLQGGSSEYNMPMVLEVAGSVDTQLLEKVVTTILQRHEVLRTRYLEIDGETMQRIMPMSEVEFNVNVVDFSHLTADELNRQVIEFVDTDVAKAFDLSADLMIRAHLIVKSQDSAVLMFNLHHIASDGWSMEVLVKEFVALYQAFSEGKDNPLPVLDIQYADYAQWQRDFVSGEVLEGQLGYWEKQLDELPVLHSLPLDKPRPEVKQHAGDKLTAQLPAEVAKPLLALAKAQGLTPFMLLHGALALLLSRHSNTNDIVIGTPVANRLQAEVEPLIGFFVNTLVLRADTGHNSLADYFSHIRQVHLDAQSNQDVPFEQLVERLKAPRNAAHSPLFQIMVSTNTGFGLHEDNQGQSFKLPGAEITPYQSDLITAKFDLEVHLSLTEQGIGLNWLYDVSLFNKAHIAQLNEHLCQLFKSLATAATPMALVPGQIDILPQTEVKQLLDGFNQTQAQFNQNLCIHELFEQQAAQHPEKIAVVAGEHQLTFAQMNKKANQLAYFLKAHFQIGPDNLVGLCVDRDAEMAIGILAILKAGGAYVPLDPSYPQDRINYMLADSKVSVVLTQTKHEAVLEGFDGEAIELDGISEDKPHWSNSYGSDNLEKEDFDLTSNHLAYVIYTSGSTGQPKGVLIEHRSVVNLIESQINCYGIGSDEVGLLLASYAFDAAGEPMFAMWLSGNTLVVPTKAQLLEPQQMLQLVKANKVTHIDSTPSHLMTLIDALNHQTVKRVISGGEAMVPQLPQALDAGKALYNVYGPTETCITSSVSTNSENIGKPVANTQFYVLSEAQTLQPKGSIGELYIGGAGLARGYLGNEALTQARFIKNPFFNGSDANSSERIYRTGDLVRYLDDGALAFLGRADSQVKIRGFRIELGEIESLLGSLADVESALVMVDEQGDSTKLIGYVQSNKAEGKQLQQQLKAKLPEYMVPSAILVVEQWPLTPSGKIDKRALPKPDNAQLQGEYVAPVGEVEQTLVEIWSELLNIASDELSTEANFFELGGHSLLSIRLVAEVRSRLNVELPVQSIFDKPSIALLAQDIAAGSAITSRPALKAVAREDVMPVSFAQQRLWFIDSLQGESSEYNMPMALEVSGQLDIALLQKVFDSVLARHEVLRSVYQVVEGQTYQKIRDIKDVEFDIHVEDLSHMTGAALEAQVKARVEADILKPFDLANDLMLRVSFIKKTADTGVLLFNMHHIASDGWSMEVLFKDFIALYEAYSQDMVNPLPALEIQYADYAHWQRTYLEGEVLDAQLGYWQEQLEDVPAVHSLPLDYPRPEKKQYTGAVVQGQLSQEISEKLQAVAHQYQLTPFMLLHGALSLLLSRHSNSNDIVIGTPVANRTEVEVEPLIGFFVNTLVLRANTAQDSLSDYFAHIRQVHLDAQANQDVPFEQLVDKLNVARNTAHSALFQIMLTTNTDFGLNENGDVSQYQLPGVDISAYQSDMVNAKFDMKVDLNLNGQGVGLRWTYDVSLFSEERIQGLNQHLCRLLEALSDVQSANGQGLGELQMLSQAELNHQLVELNQTASDYDKQQCLHQLFEQTAKVNPDAVALVFDDKQLSYKDLNEKANQLAFYLKAMHNVGPDVLVGICVERSMEMVIAILAVLKAGGAYVPMEPGYPQERLSYMIEDADIQVLLSQSHLTQVGDIFSGSIVNIDGLAEGQNPAFNAFGKDNLPAEALTSKNLAYVIYTSGSTGKPKGVLTEHQALMNFGHGFIKQLQLCQNDYQNGWLWLSSYIFDASLKGLYLLARGTKLIVPTAQNTKSPSDIVALINQHNIGIVNSTPQMLEMIVSTPELPAVDVIASGEAIGAARFDTFSEFTKQNGTTFINAYGPTETTVNSSFADLTASSSETMGRPLANTTMLVLDEQLNVVPFGAVGQLYIGGDSLARGYLNRDELTEAVFIDNPYYQSGLMKNSPRLYRSGDLVKLLPGGGLAYMSRIDDQVKIRGFRIELGEIEAQLAALQGVESAVVLAKEIAGTTQLVGYIKSLDDVDPALIAADKIQNMLKQQLPEYMVPGFVQPVASWPLTISGKLDKKQLPLPEAIGLSGEYVAPETETEIQLAGLWAELMGIEVEKISATAEFFDLGGNSIMLIKVLHQIQQTFDIEMTVDKLYHHQNLSSLSAFIDEERLITNMTELEDEESQWEI